MKRLAIISLSILLVLGASAQNKKSKEPERQPDGIDRFLHRIDTTHELNISAINKVINYGYFRFAAHAEWKLSNSTTRDEMAYWEWFLAYLQITSRKDMEGGFIHTEKALDLTRDSGEFLCQILALRVKYYDSTLEFGKEIATLDEINEITNRMSGKPAFWACVKKAKLLKHLNRTDESLKYYNMAISAGSNDSIELADTYYNRALILLHSTNDSAIIMSDLEMATALNDKETKYLYEHARLCREWYDTVPEYRAVMTKECERILQLDTMPTLSSIRHCALAMLGRKFEAERWIDQVMANFGDKQNNWVYIYYNKACIYAILNDVQQAMDYLTEAEMRGAINCAKLRDDANFYNLIDTDEFEELMLRVCME